MLHQNIKNIINSSDHFITFKNDKLYIKQIHDGSMFFCQGIKEIKSKEDLIDTNIEWLAQYNSNITQQYINDQNAAEEYTIFHSKSPVIQKDISFILKTNQLIVFNRWQEPYKYNNKVIGLFSHTSLKNHNNTFEIYEDYKKYFLTEETGRKAFISYFNLNNIYPNLSLSDSMIKEILYQYEITQINKYLIPHPQYRANCRYKLRKHYSKKFSRQDINYLISLKINEIKQFNVI